MTVLCGNNNGDSRFEVDKTAIMKSIQPKKEGNRGLQINMQVRKHVFQTMGTEIATSYSTNPSRTGPKSIPYFYCCSCYILDEQLDNF